MIDTFTKSDFESSLPTHRETGEPLWVCLGLKQFEYTYRVAGPDRTVSIEVRSSIWEDGMSAPSGKNSLRAWLVDAKTGKPVGSKVTRWTTRLPGWQKRLREVLRTLWLWRLRAGDCPKCGKPKGIWKVKKEGANKGRPFAKCSHCGNGFVWLDEKPRETVYFTEEMEDDLGDIEGIKVPESPTNATAPPQTSPDSTQEDPRPEGLDFLSDTTVDIVQQDEQEPKLTPAPEDPTREPNPEQLAAITASVDSAVRVLAPPGSGKTFVLARRYAYLLENGAKPEDILAVTFNRNMADELLQRIIRVNPSVRGTAAEHQVCTIHAACYRMLKAAGDARHVPKTWKMKKALQEIAERLWPYADDRPGWTEIDSWITEAKFHNVTSSNDLDFFTDRLGGYHGRNLHEARLRFDQAMYRQNALTFADMLFDTEQKLERDRAFRAIWQKRYKHVICDEFQDTSSQAMRILTTLAAPQNRMFAVGDSDQCILEGELVLTPQGYKPIEEIEKYNKVISAIGNGKVAARFVTETSKRTSKVTVTTIETEKGFQLRATHNHIVFASIAGRSACTKHHAPDLHYVYIMFKRSHGWRIGTTKNPRTRMRGEDADAMWLIRTYDNVTEALYDENLLSYRYGIPKMTFQDHSTRDKRRTASNLTQSWIDKLFGELDTKSSIANLAYEEGLDFSQLPHIVPQNREARVSVYLDFCDRAPRPKQRCRKTSHKLRVETSHEPSIDTMLQAGFHLRDTKKGKRLVEYSVNLKQLEKKARFLDTLLGGHLLIRGQFFHKDDYKGNYSLIPQAMPAGNVLPGFLVPVYDEKTNKIMLEKVRSVTKESAIATVYDLEVMDTANFIAGGLVVHNCLYRFAGATPEANLFNGFEQRYPDGQLVKLSTNYRSTHTIIETCQRLIAQNYTDAGGLYDQKYLKDMQPRPDAPEGQPVTFQMYDSPEAEAVALVDNLLEAMAPCPDCGGTGQIVEPITSDPGSLAKTQCFRCLERPQRKPGDFFVGARTRAQLGYLEGPLTRAKIPFINIAGGSFWGSKHTADVVAYLALAYNEGNDKAFSRVFNIGSRWNTYSWGKHEGEYCPHRFLGKAFLSACQGSYSKMHYASRTSFQPGIEDLLSFIHELQANLTDGPAAVLRVVVDDCYRRYLEAEEGIRSSDEAENGKLSDLETVIDVAGQFKDVGEFLDYVREAIAAAEAAKDKDWSEHAVISTVHRLKGLERPVVYGVGLSEGYTISTIPKPAGLLPHTFSMTPPPQNGVLPGGGMGRIADERCIAFVLCSRAQDEVHLSGCATYRKTVMNKSRFIDELGIETKEESGND